MKILTRKLEHSIRDQFQEFLKVIHEKQVMFSNHLIPVLEKKYPMLTINCKISYPSLNKSIYEDTTQNSDVPKIRFHENNYYCIDIPKSNSEVKINHYTQEVLNTIYEEERNMKLWGQDCANSYQFFDKLVRESSKFDKTPMSQLPQYFSHNHVVISNSFKKRKEKSNFYKDWFKYKQKSNRGFYTKIGRGYEPYFPGDEEFVNFQQEIETIKGTSPSSESRGEREVRLFLLKNGMKFFPQQKFKNCFNIVNGKKYLLKFDFFLPDKKLLIEVDGKQHYEPVDFFGGEITFKKQKERDNIKNDFCDKENLELIRIPYQDLNRITEILSEKIY